MKNLVVTLTFIFLTQFTYSQDILDGIPRDGAYDKDIRDGGKTMIQDYQYVRESDMWSTKLKELLIYEKK